MVLSSLVEVKVKAECSLDSEEFGDKACLDWLDIIDTTFQPSTQSKSITSIKLKNYVINPSVDSHEQNEYEMPKEVDDGMQSNHYLKYD
jgi:hypothetical protein